MWDYIQQYICFFISFYEIGITVSKFHVCDSMDNEVIVDARVG